MNSTEAMAVARERWGASAFVANVGQGVYQVGRDVEPYAPLPRLVVYGSGDSYEAAFGAADKRQ